MHRITQSPSDLVSIPHRFVNPKGQELATVPIPTPSPAGTPLATFQLEQRAVKQSSVSVTVMGGWETEG